MSNQDFFAASVNARRAGLQREARASRVARQALRAGRRSAKSTRRKATAVARDHAVTEPSQPGRGGAAQPARTGTTSAAAGLQATAICGS
ncbi:MAG TPA: hypothetical protein VGL75_12450 [Acidothermaceae bacterium]|jgi:hypothetical protein